MPKAHVLYRFYSATGQLLYVGITMNPPQRFKSHRDTKEWWDMVSGITVETYKTREDLAAAERRAIQVEHPQHNIVHAKAKPAPQPQEPVAPSPPPMTNTEAANLFPTPGTFESLGSLFGRDRYLDTRYGYITKEQYERRVAEGRAKEQARRDCPLCDNAGYRNMRLCDHIDRGESPLAAALRRVQKETLQVVQGGDA